MTNHPFVPAPPSVCGFCSAQPLSATSKPGSNLFDGRQPRRSPTGSAVQTGLVRRPFGTPEHRGPCWRIAAAHSIAAIRRADVSTFHHPFRGVDSGMGGVRGWQSFILSSFWRRRGCNGRPFVRGYRSLTSCRPRN